MLRSFILLLLFSNFAVAEKLIVPPKQIVKIAKMLAYEDFPTYVDILSICAVESNYKQFAKNPEKGISSVGVMQVRGGVYNLDANMGMGVTLLRQYYKRLGSSENAIRSYNVGIGTFKAGKAKISADQYYGKFLKRRAELAKYFNEQKR